MGSALIHATVVSDHFAEWAPAGVFFLAIEVLEVVLALAVCFVWRPAVARLVIVSSLATVLVWAWSRTFGMPFGPAEFRVAETVAPPDLACCLLEVAAALLAIPMAGLRSGPTRPVGGRAAAALLVVAALAVTLWGLGLVPGASAPSDHHHPESLGGGFGPHSGALLPAP